MSISDDQAASAIAQIPDSLTCLTYGLRIKREGDQYFLEGEQYPLDVGEAIETLAQRGDGEQIAFMAVGGEPPKLKETRKPRKPGKTTAKEDISGLEILYPPTLRALSIAGAYAHIILYNPTEKPSESRTWPTNFRGLVLLHVSTSSEWGSPEEYDIDPNECPKMSILGAAIVSDCIWNDSDELWEHVMSDPTPFEKPIKGIPGARNYWRPNNPRQVAGFNQAWINLQALGKV